MGGNQPARRPGTDEEAAPARRGIGRYPEEELRASWLLLAGHPVLQELRVRNHRHAEGSSSD